MRIEDRLENAGRSLRSSVAGDGVDDALSAVVDGSPRGAGGARWVLLVAAAVVAVLAGVVGVMALGGDDERLVADEGETTESSVPETTTSVPDGPDIVGEALGAIFTNSDEVGSIWAIGIPAAFADLWTPPGDPPEPVPEVDFDEQLVVVFTIAPQNTGACLGPLEGLVSAEDSMFRPHFAGSPRCPPVPDGGLRYFLAVDRDDLPGRFDLVLDSDLVDGAGPYVLYVDTSEDFTSFTPVQPGSSGLPAPDGPDLEAPEPGREITFDAIGDVRLGDTLGPAEFDRYESPASTCGYWGPSQPTLDGDQPLDGLVSIQGDVGSIISVMVRENPRYRTASGVGVGTTLATLERIYGDDLVVDRTRTLEPTNGLMARYHDVAAVRNGDRALTFTLYSDVVQTVKLSSADFWGDDEGCA